MFGFIHKSFWATVHIATIAILLSGYMTLTDQQFPFLGNEVPTATIVASAVDSTYSSTSVDTSTTMDLVNAYRAEHNLGILSEDQILTQMAIERADDMVRNQYFGHKNLEGKIFFQLLNERSQAPKVACENLSLSYSPVIEAPFRGWKDSPPHNSCMLDSRMKTVGYAFREYGETYDESGTLQKHYIVVAIQGS